ncbi:phosphotransferase family protein [Actinoalloteichus hymeniacidonis]|uniref:Aminoglycoside phosphotransferase n=1 Tax=Actinoalloteichus hymeniacidonis TaxID=340345 RepID=A0AAC9HPL4_9PSEU|nr:aminoglycoside phosphotransferase family protein [Actinoalloteichus hymeniacidonis]AOS63056.1 putative aminoglycoside phosphotransferase [Actinoalloteichus hymeniacidonis]MBB5908909.1 aminoglycoside phosphotransferase (APT) family kinase protein [Actinoalloteichus hymeniacidonis]
MSEVDASGLADADLTGLVTAAGLAGPVVSRTRLGGGMYNAVERVELADGQRLILKVAPDPTLPTLRYERDILRTEALFYRQASRVGAPVPSVLHTAFDRAQNQPDVLLMTELPGVPWAQRASTLSDSAHRTARRSLGGVVVDLHRVTGQRFGYPTGAVGPTEARWQAAFLTMLDAVLADARRFEVALPWGSREIRATIRGAAGLGPGSTVADGTGLLAAITTPVLVHFDLWPGNLLLAGPDEAPVISGVIDGERAFWGDPAADLVSLALFDDVEKDEDLLTAYRDAGGAIVFDDATRTRQALYRVYLYLIMLVETVPRATAGDALRRLEHRVGGLLVDELSWLRRQT